MEFKGADMSQFGSLNTYWLSCALHLLHSMHSNISVGQLGVITANGAARLIWVVEQIYACGIIEG